MAAQLSPGAIIGGRYRLDHRLGEGGMGVVWAARQIEGGRAVALKLLKDATSDPETHRRVMREARAASAVKHAHVVEVLDVIEGDDGSPVIVMELLDGESLATRLRRERKIPFGDLAAIALPVLSAVGAAHAAGVIHRDLKPENIFLARGPGGATLVKVLDFGIAKMIALDEETARSSGLTTSALVGTPAYMSPEQVFGERDIDGRADGWALGIIFYQALSGVLPTAGQNVGQVFKNILARPFKPLTSLAADVPEEAGFVIGRMLSRDRALRPADLHEVLTIFAPDAHPEVPAFGPPARVIVDADDEEVASFEPAPGPTLDLGTGVLIPERAHPTSRGRARPTRRLVAWLAALGALAALVGAGVLLRPAKVRPEIVAAATIPSPLAAPEAALACPVLAASGADEPAGWLGAAAAATVCERARVILGGRSERIRMPAALLGLHREPLDDFPADPYAAPDARPRSLAAARERAAAFVDGEVSLGPSGFRVTLALHRASGEALARGSGTARALGAAVRAAMDPLVEQGALPVAPALDADVATWSRARDVPGALALLDLTLAIAHNAGTLPDECARADAASARFPDLAPFTRWLCAYTLGVPAPIEAELLPAATSPGALAARARIDHMVNRHDDPEAILALERALDHEASGYGRSLLAATASCLLQASDARRAYETALRAVQSDPENPDGHFCSPWSQLVAVTTDTASAESTVRAMQAWEPWDSNAWMMQALSPRGDAAASLRAARRASTLSPLDAAVADVLAGKLLAAGAREEARSVALTLIGGGKPVHLVESELILIRVDASEARFAAALARAERALDLGPDDAGWVRVQRLEIAWRALGIAQLLGGATALADRVVARFLDPEPPPLDGVFLSVPMRLPAICALASKRVARRCFARLRALRDRLSGGILPSTEAFTAGAERWAEGNIAAAAAAWRPLLREPGMLAEAMPDAMVSAFEHTGDAELVERIDALVALRANELNGATPADLRASRRALARGDAASAVTAARRVVTAWSVADAPVPAVEEMRRVIAAHPR